MVPWRRNVDMHPGKDWGLAIPDTPFQIRPPDWKSTLLVIGYQLIAAAIFLALLTFAPVEAAFFFIALALVGELVLIALLYPWLRDRFRSHQGRVTAIQMLGPQLLSDVLSYNRCRDEIFKMVEARRAEAVERQLVAGEERPILMMGLSLGGIILVDYLGDSSTKKDGVGALLTVGTQAPLLYAFDALEGVRYPAGDQQRRVKPFPIPWINVYNPTDYMSFVAKPLFGSEGIEDRTATGRDAFPKSHSLYWTKDVTWTAVRDGLAEAGSYLRSKQGQAASPTEGAR
jgi:hypothetical protein